MCYGSVTPRLIGTPSARCLTRLLCRHLPGPHPHPRPPGTLSCSLELRVLTAPAVMMWEIRVRLFTVTDLEPWPGVAHQQRARWGSLGTLAWERQVCLSPNLMVTVPTQHRSLRLLHFRSHLSLLSEGPGRTVLSAGLRWFLRLSSLKTLWMLGEFCSPGLWIHDCLMNT